MYRLGHRNELLGPGSVKAIGEIVCFTMADAAETLEEARKENSPGFSASDLLVRMKQRAESGELLIMDFSDESLARGMFDRGEEWGPVSSYWVKALNASIRPEHSVRLIQLRHMDEVLQSDLLSQVNDVYGSLYSF